ncbi:hypothetical protein BG011_003477 [Mortierella polycephala]|uniref:Uncharacterized protein n=1 Tax=Mortierella polycephala TaxID=41804 RepID=A0A9P6QGY7_9FUNG|nr:hypothetical protein BG011_003477 [Mortierella polycephala]
MRLSASFIVTASIVALSASIAEAYGVLGHTLTGQIAQVFLTPKTVKEIHAILPPSYDGLLSNAAPWPDTVRWMAKYKWASPLHFVNPPNDNPPEKCLFEYIYDGQDNVNGLFNMTATLKKFQQKPPTTQEQKTIREDALKFFVHFMGDIHQPLHDSTRDRGGNDAPILWRRAKKNLHSMWDTLIIVKDVKDRFDDNPQAYLDDTVKLAKTHWKSEAKTWSVCDAGQNDIKNPWSETTSHIKALCPIQWANVTNALDCEYVWKDYSPTRDYSTDYFDNVTGASSDFLVQKLLAISGVRMAAVLNEIYDPSAKPPLTERSDTQLPPRYLRLLERTLTN